MNSDVSVGILLASDHLHVYKVRQEGQHPLTGQRAANFRLLANQ